jgi:hypothetical protein
MLRSLCVKKRLTNLGVGWQKNMHSISREITTFLFTTACGSSVGTTQPYSTVNGGSFCLRLHLHFTIYLIFVRIAQQPHSVLGRLIVEASRSNTLQSVGLPWTKNRPVAEKLNIHNRQISMTSSGFEPATPASEWPQTHALDRMNTGIGSCT